MENDVKEYKELKLLIKTIMKFTDKLVSGVILVSLPFLGTFFFHNYTATSIGLVIFGAGISVKLFDMKVKSKALWYMWIAIIILISVLLGIEYILPKISFN